VSNQTLRRITLALLTAASAAQAQEVIPDFYKEPGIQPNRDAVNQSQHESIDPFTGSLQRHYVDIRIPGNGGLDLKVIRSYNSSNVDPGNARQPRTTAGWGWTIHFGRILKARESFPCLNKNTETVADNPVLELPDGSRQLLTFTGPTSPVMALTTQRWKADCIAGAGLLVTSPEGIEYQMTQSLGFGSSTAPMYEWHTEKITDRNGNYIKINYVSGSSMEISTVTTSDGRSLSFSYDGAGSAQPRIRSISGAGQTYQYSYQASGISDIYQLTRVVRPDNTDWTYEYNGNNNSSAGSYLMRSAKTPQGGTTNYTYAFEYFDSQANPMSRSNVVSRKTTNTGDSWTFSYSPGGSGSLDTTTVTTPAGNIVYKHFGPGYAGSGSVWKVGLLAEKRVGSQQVEQYVWDKQKISNETYFRPGAFLTKIDYLQTNAPLLAQKTITRDGATYRTTFSNFDTYGNPLTVSESGPNGGSRTTSLSYYTNTSKWIVKQPQNESSSGHSISRDFDSYGNLTNETRDGVSVSRSYDAGGNVSTVTFPRSLTHRYSSYMRGVPQSETQPEGISISRQVSDAGNVTLETDGNGRTTRYGYDDLNRISSIDFPVGNRITISYSATSRQVTRGALSETTAYDSFGRITGITRGGISRSYRVDALGRITFTSDPDSSSGQAYSYDTLNRLEEIRNADGSTQSISYGAGSKTVRNERNYSTTYSYRAYGDPDKTFLMEVATPDSTASVRYDRNSKDLITSATQNGWTRSFGYNSNGYLTSATHPETGTTTLGRDAAGNMTSKSVGSAGSVSYSYDSQNRLSTVNYPGSTPSVTHSYDKRHRLLKTASSEAIRDFTYDGNGNITKEELNAGGMSWQAVYGYNTNDQLTSVTYPRSGSTVNYSVNALGQPTAVTGYATSVSYWPSGQVRNITYANSTQSEYGQNSRLWPSSFKTSRSGSSFFTNATYTYDLVGNLTNISDSSDDSYSRTLGYDNMDRLTSMAFGGDAGVIAYNGVGNITRQTFGSEQLNYQYNSDNRLSALTATPSTLSTTFTYDALGNIASGSGRTYTYDAVPNLTCVNCATPATSIQYAYDGGQKRTSVTKAGVKTYEFHGVYGNLLAEYTPGAPGKLVEYIYLNGKRIAQKESAQ
jgi:YD repeat-containing protein